MFPERVQTFALADDLVVLVSTNSETDLNYKTVVTIDMIREWMWDS